MDVIKKGMVKLLLSKFTKIGFHFFFFLEHPVWRVARIVANKPRIL